MPANAPAVPTIFRLRRCLARTIWMAVLRLGLNGPDAHPWIIGGPVVLAAAWIRVKLLPAISYRWSARGALVFAAYFLRESVRGGWGASGYLVEVGALAGHRLQSIPPSSPPSTAILLQCDCAR